MTNSLPIWQQFQLSLRAKPRGFHLITDEIERQLEILATINIGILHLFIQHTSASLTINENADPTVRIDFESHINKMIPENMPYYKHDYEGADDMPAHIKSSMFGCQVQIPVTNGKLNLGTWQGIYLGEHRNYGGRRKIVLTAFGN